MTLLLRIGIDGPATQSAFLDHRSCVSSDRQYLFEKPIADLRKPPGLAELGNPRSRTGLLMGLLSLLIVSTRLDQHAACQ